MSDKDRSDAECEDNTNDATKHGAPPESRKYSPVDRTKTAKNGGFSGDGRVSKLSIALSRWRRLGRLWLPFGLLPSFA